MKKSYRKGCWGRWCARLMIRNHKLQTKNKRLEIENKQLKEALEDIAGHGCPHIYSPTCPEIAEQVLKGKMQKSENTALKD